MSLHSFTIKSILKRNAKIFPDKIALEDGNIQTTYKELFQQVQALAAGLKAEGIHKGDRIVVLSKNSYYFFMLYLAAAEIGGILVPINWRLSIDEIIYIVLDSEASVIFFQLGAEPLIKELRRKCEILPRYFILDKNHENPNSFTWLLNRALSVEEEDVKGTDPFIICYTAATQGRPIGAILSHDNIIYCNIMTALTMSLTSDDVHLNILPLYHMFDLIIALTVMHVGGKNIFTPKFDPQSVLNLIEHKKISIIGSFSPIISKLLSELSEGEYNLSSLKHVYGLEQPDMIENFMKERRCRFWSLYGQTETMLTCLSPREEKPEAAGRPQPLVELKIVDDNDQEVGKGEPGEILVRGPIVFLGYWKQEGLTKHTFRNGWHHTGDIGCLDEDGYLWFKGRKEEKELIKSGGENIYPSEVEQALFDHPDVKEAMVFGVPDEDYGEGVKTVCVLTESSKLSEQGLADFVANKIGRYKKPRYVEFVSSLPKTDCGFVDRELVRVEFSIKK